MKNNIERYKEKMDKWNKRASWILIVVLIVCILGALDIWRIRASGDFIINPYLTIFLTFGLFLLVILAFIAQGYRKKYLREAEQEKPRNEKPL